VRISGLCGRKDRRERGKCAAPVDLSPVKEGGMGRGEGNALKVNAGCKSARIFFGHV